MCDEVIDGERRVEGPCGSCCGMYGGESEVEASASNMSCLCEGDEYCDATCFLKSQAHVPASTVEWVAEWDSSQMSRCAFSPPFML